MAGRITIQSNCAPDTIRTLDFDAYFGVHARHKSIYTRRETLEKRAADAETNVALAVTEDRQIAGFGVFGPPDADDRWSQMQPGVIMEIEVVEVHRRFRACHLAGDIIHLLLAHPRIETMIAFMVGYSWTWDLRGTGLSAEAYRHVLIRLFSAFGFSEFKTNEPNVCLRPENLFMARIGRDISDKLRDDFKYLRFGVPPTNR
jgi:acetoin utilization protein AcuA